MTTIAGLPAHPLLVHLIVVLAPGTAVLEILCALWPAARRRLVWLVLFVAVLLTAMTPVTTDAGEWLYSTHTHPSAILQTHAHLGGTMIYFSVALLVAAVVLATLHLVEGRSDKRRLIANIAVAVLALVLGIASIVQVVRIGDAGSRSVWSGEGQDDLVEGELPADAGAGAGAEWLVDPRLDAAVRPHTDHPAPAKERAF